MTSKTDLAQQSGTSLFSYLRAKRIRAIRRRADAARDAGHAREAAALYEQSLELQPGNGPIHVQCGHMFKQAGELDRAEVHYTQALGLMQGDADLHLQMGHFFKVSGRYYESLGAYKRALTLSPAWPEPQQEINGLRDRLVNEFLHDRLLPAVQERVAPAPSAEVEASQSGAELPRPSLKRMQAGRLWLFMGDTIEWLTTHDRLTGVGKVTTELLLASLNDGTPSRLQPCALADNQSGLGSISLRDTVGFLAARAGTHDLDTLSNVFGVSQAPPTLGIEPRTGDHVLFTGVVWTPSYEALFQQLARRGIRFSVLVYDIIPLQHPEFVSHAHAEMFRTWLRTVLSLAETVFVSGAHVRDAILRWAALSAVPCPAQIVPISFGFRMPGLPTASPKLERVRPGSFVLCVGTIDRRKNQAMLVQLWQRLASSFGPAGAPQLVLVGRNDLAPGAIRAGKADIIVLDGLDDAELAELYRTCLFTVFPSLSEGYGLPVAESLHHGKLCIASDLPVIREHAGDLPWYYPSGRDEEAFSLIYRAIANPAMRAEAEEKIRSEQAFPSWQDSVTQITAAMLRSRPPLARLPAENPPTIPNLPKIQALETMATAATWCTGSNPTVSIIIINWNASTLTRECVRHIWAHTTGACYEIIIADNGSVPADLALLSEMGDGVRIMLLGANRFFGEANNIAAEAARGRYLCFLNNDAFVHKGWLASLVEGAEHPGVGAAGPLFLFPDGVIQEAGGTITEKGFPVRYARGKSRAEAGDLAAGTVDYISAAALLMPKDVFMKAGGYDLAFEPAYYEDADLCFKIRALGLDIRFCPGAVVTHVEGAAANDDARAVARRNILGDLNRQKFTARWSRFLGPEPVADIRDARALLPPLPLRRRQGDRLTAALFTPYNLTPGGGERYLLSTAAVLAVDHDVTLVTTNRYSQLRLASVLHELGIPPFACRMMDEAAFADEDPPAVLVVLGNHLVPPVIGRGTVSLFICQFPFPLAPAAIQRDRDLLDSYDAVLTYSKYAQSHVLAGQSAHVLAIKPVEVVYPPVPLGIGDPVRKKRIILSVGRFFSGGHSKRHDLMIEAFGELLRQGVEDVELHLAGSSMPDHIVYLEQLQTAVGKLPVFFHVNIAQEKLAALYSDAAIYWHAAGLGADLVRGPEQAEHFGISIVEAMSSGCVPLVFSAGGPREIVRQGVDGYLYADTTELVDLTRQLLLSEGDELRESMGSASIERAQAFSIDRFETALKGLLQLHQPTSPRIILEPAGPRS